MVSLSDCRVGCSVPVSDMERARAFYEGVLGLRPATDHEPDLNVSYRCAEGTTINIYVSPGAGSSTATVSGFAVDRIEQVVDELAARGVEFEQYDLPGLVTDERGVAHFPGDNRVAYFKDPDGNIHSLAQAGAAAANGS